MAALPALLYQIPPNPFHFNIQAFPIFFWPDWLMPGTGITFGSGQVVPGRYYLSGAVAVGISMKLEVGSDFQAEGVHWQPLKACGSQGYR